MDDAQSRSSMESSSTDDFVMVNGEPKLKITGNIDDIGEEISDESISDLRSSTTSIEVGKMNHALPVSQSANMLAGDVLCDVVGDGSECTSMSTEAEKRLSASLPATPHEGCMVFDGVTYLGCATVNAPRSEVEIYRNMAVLNEQSQMSIPISLSVPNTSDGSVRIIDPATECEITSYRIHNILFCARGPNDSKEKRCFAFTCSHGIEAQTAIFQCHVFRCDIPEAVAKILYCFAMTFRRLPKQRTPSQTDTVAAEMEQSHTFDVSMEFREEDVKGNFSTCPFDKNIFKFRRNLEKKIVISVVQSGPRELLIERCFGLLICPGRNVKEGDMHLIEMDSMGIGSESRSYGISGHWDPTEPSFAVLNTETPKDSRVFLTVAIDLVIRGIQEPVRFAVETKAKIFQHSERFWYFTKRVHTEQFFIKIKQTGSEKLDNLVIDVLSIESQTEIDRRKVGLNLVAMMNKHIPEEIKTPQDPEDPESDGDEPLLSGSGSVSKEVTDDNLLEAWREVLTRWQQNLSQRPKQVTGLVRKGIPEALRGEVWQLLAGCSDNQELMEAFRVVIAKDSPNEAVIQRDINRTFPAHDFFKENGGIGQESLYKLSKAYSIYDEEIGYCQGLSFLAAALLLHMPEEQAFVVLAKIMFDYGLRDLFKEDFLELHLKFYQIERLMQDQLPDMYEHFEELNLEAHMFASQWFLTLFTAKFPLSTVFHILDIFLSEGRDIIFSVALALLKQSRKDLLALDFEGVLKYFRVHLPKRYRSEENAKELVRTAISSKVSSKKLKKYEKEYFALKEQEQDPRERLENDNRRLMEANIRLEQENDDLAHELVTSKLQLCSDLNQIEEKAEVLNGELLSTHSRLVEIEEEKRRLETESQQLKEMYRREVDRSETDNSRNGTIIADYKQICTQLSERLEKQNIASHEEIQKIRAKVKTCDDCSKLFDSDGHAKIPSPDSSTDLSESNPRIDDLARQVRVLELELAQTKLALVESECMTQDLTHQLNGALSCIQASKNTWLQKTLTSIKEVATQAKPKDSKDTKDVKDGKEIVKEKSTPE